MPSYDPKANRPKLVPVDDAQSPIDVILGHEPSEETGRPTDSASVPRAHLSVVPAEGAVAAPTVVPAETPDATDRHATLAIAVVAATVLGIIVAWRGVAARRRSD